eukprot:jgi/Hompol1/114/HPOL_005227-RA
MVTKGDNFIVEEDNEEFAELVEELMRPNDTYFELEELCNKFERLCRDRATAHSTAGRVELARSWLQEADTWLLFSMLTTHPVELADMDTDAGQIQTGASKLFKSDSDRIEKATETDEIKELKLVKRWLEKIAPEFHAVEIRKALFSNTISAIRNQRRQGDSLAHSFGSSDQIVSELDPDATTRQHRRLAPEDQRYEAELLRTIYEYIRRGKLNDAIDLCNECDQPWRAVSLGGGEVRGDNFIDGFTDLDNSDFVGNENAVLWKATCYAISKNEEADPYERAIYAVLSGDFKNALQVCRTWEDHVWIRFNAVLETKINKVTSSGSYLVPADQEIHLHLPDFNTMPLDILTDLCKNDDPKICKESAEPFHVIQCHLILSSLDLMYWNLRCQLSAIESDPTTSSIPNIHQVLRCVTHMIIVLQKLNAMQPTDDTDYIITRYIDFLQTAGKPADVDGESEELSQLVARGEMCGIDMVSTCEQTLRRIFARGAVLDKLPEEVPSVMIDGTEDPVPDPDWLQIHAIEWILIPDTLEETKLEYINHLLRRFFIAGRIQSVKALLDNYYVSPDYMATLKQKLDRPRMDAILSERIIFQHLVECFAIQAHWRDHFHKQRPPGDDRQTQKMLEWTNRLKTITAETVEKMETLLTTQSLESLIQNCQPNPSISPQHELELRIMASIYTPEIVLGLHRILYETRTYIPSNLERSLELANLVAGAKGDGLYEEMKRSNKLGVFMRCMRESALAILGQKKPLFS